MGSSQFDIPSIKYTPRIKKSILRPKTVIPKKRMLAGSKVRIEKMDPLTKKDSYFDTDPEKSEVWQKMSSYITAKFSDDQSVRDLFLSKMMKDKIFQDIQNKFTKGEKL